MKDYAIYAENLRVSYRRGWRTRTDALKGLSLDVAHGEVFGFLGPNGAGKSTTIKTLLGFVFPTSGTASILGEPAGSLAARRRVGYLPETALYYPYLKAKEFLNLYARVQGLSAQLAQKEIPMLLEKVGLPGKENALLKHFSKGMLQRVGLAQALLGDPDLFIFDEPASGLDPLGRRDLRQVIIDLKSRGKTIFFSSHELSEVELICHRIAIVKNGRVIKSGELDEVVQPLDERRILFYPSGTPPESLAGCQATSVSEPKGAFEVYTQDKAQRLEVLRILVETKSDIIDVRGGRQSLEDFFVNMITHEDADKETRP